jgi:GNAT superfamily N-acetyltransferase
MSSSICIRPAQESDLVRIAAINTEVFLGDRDKLESAQEWIRCWFSAFPLYHYFVIEVEGRVAGYAGWQAHGGFQRPEPVIELDQIGIDKAYQSQGLAPQLVQECTRQLVEWVQHKNERVESHVTFVVWAYTLNFNAMNVYAKQFVDGVCGFRTQFGQRAESMLRLRVPLTRPVRDEV